MKSVPTQCCQQQLIYKRFDNGINDLHFFPPLTVSGVPAPILLLIPGGGWHRNDSISMYNMAKPAADVLRQHGFAVASITYRGSVPDGASMTEIVSDVLDAMGYLARYKDVLNIDPTRFYTMGHSAGGHLAAQVAYMTPAQRKAMCAQEVDVRACVGLASALTLIPREREQYYTFALPPEETAVLFPSASEDMYFAYSPCHIEGKPTVPTFLAAGDADQLVDHRISLQLYQRLLAAGQQAEWVVCHGGGHCFEPVDGSSPSPGGIEIMVRSAEFILKHSS